MTTEITWNSLLKTIMDFPGITVNRRVYLREVLKNYCDEESLEKAITSRPDMVISTNTINRIANSAIGIHTAKATAISAIAGIPNGVAAVAVLPIDVAQYYFHLMVLTQKLAYLYGYPDLTDENGKFTEDTLNILTLFIGSMVGVAGATKALQELTELLAKQTIKNLSKAILSKSSVYQIVKSVSDFLGKNITKKAFSNATGKAIPLIGIFVSGGLTLASFLPYAKTLRNKLENNMILFN